MKYTSRLVAFEQQDEAVAFRSRSRVLIFNTITMYITQLDADDGNSLVFSRWVWAGIRDVIR